jgi:hypothetical protein
VKRLRLLALPAVLAAVAAGCNLPSFPGPAATVNGVAIPESAVNAQLDALGAGTSSPTAAQKQALCIAGITLGPTSSTSPALQNSLNGSEVGTSTPAAADVIVQSLIQTEFQRQELVRAHRTVTAADRTAARQDLETQLGSPTASGQSCGGTPGSSAVATGTTILDKAPKVFVDQQVTIQAVTEQLISLLAHVPLTTAGLEAYYKAHPDQFSGVCVLEVLYPTEAAATAGQVTDLQSQATTTNAQSGCLSNNVLATNPQEAGLAALLAGLGGIGKVSQPQQVPDQNGNPAFALLEITSEPTEPFSAALVRGTVVSIEQPVLQASFAALARADIVTDPRYGSWDRTQGLLPPAIPKPAILLNPTAGQPASSGLSGLPAGLGSPTGG